MTYKKKEIKYQLNNTSKVFFNIVVIQCAVIFGFLILEVVARANDYPKNIELMNSIVKLDYDGGVSYRSNITNTLPGYPGKLYTDITGYLHNGIPRNEEELTNSVFIFGGSTVEGRGASSNELTISALLEKCLNSYGKNYKVINAGFSGDYSYQQYKRAMIAIGKYNPKKIIFLDGRNDAHYSTLKNVTPFNSNSGLKGPFDNINNINSVQKIIYELSKHSGLISFLINKEVMSLKSKDDEGIGENKNNISKNLNVYMAYYATHEAMRTVGRTLNIETYFYLQPTLDPSLKELTIEEQKLYKNFLEKRKLMNDYYVKVIEFYKTAINDKKIINISNLFVNENKTLYVDSVHYNDYGNKLIAARICEDIK